MIADFALVLFALLVFLTIKYGGGFLRAAALIIVFFLIANPSFRKKSRAPSPVLAVCLDTSSSMGVKERGSSRIDKARALIRKELPVLKKKFTLLFYAFDSGVRPLDEKDFFKVKPSGKASLISQNAAAITASLPEGASMLLFSDGRDTSPEGHYFSKPVHCAGLGLSAVNDISVKMLSYPEKAFQGAVSKVRVRVERTGGAGFCRVRIRRRGEIAGEKEINFAEGESLKDCDVEFVPREAGNSLKYRVELSPSDGKPENNSDFFTVSVFKSKIKVMFISGRPGWEYRNLRALIKSDKRIDLTSFVILRNPADYVPFPDNKLSLIPFPVREIFLKDITQ
ncbi:MAG: hypothetical protein J7M11_02065, partial [Elusimicrobia bacterium]|nr:hypothetical protein [Elusimicrobiota bacterium]